MDHDFWLGLWERGRIPFHGHAANPLMVAHLPALNLPTGARIFLPLCGKTVDIGWLRARGFRVAGAELSRIAVEQAFDMLGEAPQVTAHGPLHRFSARNVDIWQGDIFDLTPALLGPVDAVYDRAALIALPPDMRPSYAAHLQTLAPAAPHLLLTFLHEGTGGPPFAVGEPELRRLYPARSLTLLHEAEPEDDGARDQVWHIA